MLHQIVWWATLGGTFSWLTINGRGPLPLWAVFLVSIRKITEYEPGKCAIPAFHPWSLPMSYLSSWPDSLQWLTKFSFLQLVLMSALLKQQKPTYRNVCIQALLRLRLEDCQFQTSHSYISSWPCIEQTNKHHTVVQNQVHLDPQWFEDGYEEKPLHYSRGGKTIVYTRYYIIFKY